MACEPSSPKKPDRLYKILDDEDNEWYISAFTYGEAVHYWRQWMATLSGVEPCQIEEPSLVVFVADEDYYNPNPLG